MIRYVVTTKEQGVLTYDTCYPHCTHSIEDGALYITLGEELSGVIFNWDSVEILEVRRINEE